MTLVAGAYCGLGDLRKGDIPLPAYMGNGTSYVQGAAEEIDAALGHIYSTPFAVSAPTDLTRPSVLTLKKINWLIASGRLVLDLAASGENNDLHSYGKRMLDEGLQMLLQIVSGQMILDGAEAAEKPEDDENRFMTGPAIYNEDEESLVQAFYARHSPYSPTRLDAPDPYAGKK